MSKEDGSIRTRFKRGHVAWNKGASNSIVGQYKNRAEYRKMWREQHRDYLKKYHRDWYYLNHESRKKLARKLGKKRYLYLKISKPWYLHFYSAKNRCTLPCTPSYQNYGGRGIRMLLTLEEIKTLWFRDKALLLKRPSLDRIDSSKDYSYQNCRFIELSENVRRANCARKLRFPRGEVQKLLAQPK